MDQDDDKQWQSERRQSVARQRAKQAEVALERYLEENSDLRFAAANLIADLLHYADQQDRPLDRETLNEIFSRAMRRYSEESGPF